MTTGFFSSPYNTFIRTNAEKIHSETMKKHWPDHCVWAAPIPDGEGMDWNWDLAEMQELDEDGEELKEIKIYMDDLVHEGRLNEDYSLNEDYIDPDMDDVEDAEEDSEWQPAMGTDYWDEGFDVEGWAEDLSRHINYLKIEIVNVETDPVIAVRDIIRYEFINENLMRQAFTRRAFSQEYGLSGCSEELEFYGDQVLGMVITREIARRFSDTNIIDTGAPFRSHLNEGELSRIRAKFVSKEHLSRRAEKLGLDRFILYGTGEEPGDSAREDMMEALIGAVAVDSGWDTAVLEEVVDRLIALQLDRPDELLRESYYEQLNTWHQKHFGCLPEYELTRHMLRGGGQAFYCSLKYLVPENDKGIRTSQRIDIEDETRSSSREYAARRAVSFIRENGLWMNLSDSGCEPDPEKSINQLQELFQKKYVKEPVYTFEQMGPKEWYCTCVCNGFDGWGRAVGKTRAKKDAAFMVLKELMKAGGRNDQV